MSRRNCSAKPPSAMLGAGTPGNPFSPPVHLRQRRILQKIRQFAERQRDHREIDADAAQRQKSDEDAEGRGSRDADRHGEPDIVQVPLVNR